MNYALAVLVTIILTSAFLLAFCKWIEPKDKP